MTKLATILCVIHVSACTASADMLSILPSATTVTNGTSVILDVNVSGTSDLFAFQFDIGFNPAVLSATSVTEGALFSGVGVFFSPGFIDNTAGTITFIGDSLSGFGLGLSTDGTLATITFNTIGLGSSTVDLANVLLLDSGLNDIAATSSGSTVTVQGETVVPEPGTALLLLSALGVIGWRLLFGRLRRSVN